jgi:ATP-dependent Lon protease
MPMTRDAVIPLLPLSIVVFPGQALPLHIFEPRYKVLIARCRRAAAAGEQLPFGISLGQDSSLERDVGCGVTLQKVLNEYEDGRMDIITLGSERYRLKEVFDDEPYLTAAVEFFVDESEQQDVPQLRHVQEQYGRLSEIVELETGSRLEVPAPDTAFQLAVAAVLDQQTRQALLESVSENERFRLLATHFAQLIAAMSERQQSRARVRSNGRHRPH